MPQSTTDQVITFDLIADAARQSLREQGYDKTSLYWRRLQFEVDEVKKQAADQYWVGLVNSGKRFTANPNSLLLPWALGICDVDPIKDAKPEDVACTANYADTVAYLNKHKKLPPGISQDMDKPDIDIDCLPNARDEIKSYAAKRFGGAVDDGYGVVASVATWSSYLFKQALQDVAMATKWCTKEDVFTVTKILPDEADELKDGGASKCKGKIKDASGIDKDCETVHCEHKCPKCGSADTETPTIGKLLAEHPPLRSFAEAHPKVVDFAVRLVGKFRHLGKHAGALIIADRPLYGNVPMMRKKSDDQWVCLWSEGRTPSLSKFGYTKWDILGLKTLQYIDECCKLINKNHGISFGTNMSGLDEIDPEDERAGYFYYQNEQFKINLNDPAAIRLANKQYTDAVFQFDTELAKRILSNGVRSFYDLLIFNAMGHPGPMAMIPDYVERRDDERMTWKNKDHPLITETLGETFNTIVYQEQLQAVWQRLAGFTSPEAQEARKAVAKKWKDKLKPVEEKWLRGAEKTLGKAGAAEWWAKMVSFGRYAFNKSHAISYCLVAYRCLWLKANFAAEWWSSVMSHCNRDKLIRYMGAARSEGARFAKMHVGRLSQTFSSRGGEFIAGETLTTGGVITPGLLGVKDVGKKGIDYCGDFEVESIDSMVAKCGKSRTIMERLIKLGAFRKVPGHENAQALWNWYLFKYGSGKEVPELKKTIRAKLLALSSWDETTVEVERKRQIAEYRKAFPKRNKIPKKIENWQPKIEETREAVMALFPDDYTPVEFIRFEEEYLGYTITSPLTLFKTHEGCTITAAKETGILEAVIVDKQVARTKNGNIMCRLTVTDGVQSAQLILWADQLQSHDKYLLKRGCGVRGLVEYNQKFGSFSLASDGRLVGLEKKYADNGRSRD